MQITGDWEMIHVGHTNLEKFTNPEKNSNHGQRQEWRQNVKKKQHEKHKFATRECLQTQEIPTSNRRSENK